MHTHGLDTRPTHSSKLKALIATWSNCTRPYNSTSYPVIHYAPHEHALAQRSNHSNHTQAKVYFLKTTTNSFSLHAHINKYIITLFYIALFEVSIKEW